MGRQIIAFKQQQKISSKAIQSLQVLALPITALSEFIDGVMMENPVIELDYERKDIEVSAQEIVDDSAVRLNYSQRKKDLMDALAEGSLFGSNVPESETLHGFLRLQLLNYHLTEEQERLGEEIIENINEDGYFVGNLRELCYYRGLSVSTGEEILNIIHTFYPKGVGARSIAECIVLQIDQTIPNFKKIVAMIENDLEELADRKIMKLSRKYGMKKAEVQKVLDYIQALNPRPGSEFYKEEIVNYVIPDVVINRENSTFSIGLNEQCQYHLSINKQYLQILNDTTVNESQRDYIRKKYNEAKMIMNSLEMRESTLKKIAMYLLHVQRPFFEHGKLGLQPVMMKEAAEFLGLHVSTISRAVQEKYIQTPWGVFPLRYFFSSTVSKYSDEHLSPEVVKIKIREIIEKEDTLHPFSDCDITEVLNKEGINISRRTVAKYRQVLGIPGQIKRNRFHPPLDAREK